MYWTKSELITGLRSHMRDPTSTATRWSDAEMLLAVNAGIGAFSGRVGFYVEAPMEGDDNDLWYPPAYMTDQILVSVDGVSTGTYVKPGDAVIEDAVIEGWVYNQLLPSGTFTVSGGYASGATTMTVVSTDDAPPILGHVLVGLEVIRYNGVVPLSSTTYQLTNLQRNQNGGGDNAALNGAAVDFAIYYDDPALRDVLNARAAAYLHSMYITDGSPTEIGHHQWAMRWDTQQEQIFWRRYVPGKQYRKLPVRRPY